MAVTTTVSQPTDSPDRDILTPKGCQKLLSIGEKALTQLMRKGLPYIETSNSYRYPRVEVIEWVREESRRRRPPRDS